jgi:DNA-binding NarL/FixJ family response regulator
LRVVELLLLGLSHKEIAERLFISPDTVKKRTCNAYRKLGVQNRVQLSYFVQNRVAMETLPHSVVSGHQPHRAR